jgi:hypothetical protein
MAFQLTERARLVVQQTNLEPNISVSIDGIDTVFGSSSILKVLKYGDPYNYGDNINYGDLVAIVDQETIISLDGSTNSIKQQLDIDKGRGSSITSMDLVFVDFDSYMTNIISPGNVVTDILGRRVKVKLGFQNLAFPEDYITIFRGTIESVTSEAGAVVLSISHPEQKKKAQLYTKSETALNGAINNSTTNIVVDSTSGFITKVLGPDGTYDSSFSSFVRIDDEIIKFDGFTGNSLNGVVRGQFNTTAASHADDASVSTIYRIQGNCVDLALKFMLSGTTGNMFTGESLTNFNLLSTIPDRIQNSIYFLDKDVKEEYGIVIGDYITTTGATNGANNVSLKEITDIQKDDYGTYIVVDGVTFVDESNSSATISFRSKYDTLPSGLKMLGDEVDIEQHELLFQRFLSSLSYDFLLKESIENAKDFIEQEIYRPAAAYSLPRKARASMGFHVSPIPSQDTITISENNIIDPDQIKLKRSINKNFFNTVVYKFEEDFLEDKFLRGRITQSATSFTRFGNDIGVKALVLESKGMRESLSAQSLALSLANRRLNRYKFGAEFFDNMKITYGTGFNVEIGDIILLDGSNLQISNTQTGERGTDARLFEIVNKTLNFKTGEVTLNLVDTNFDTQARYALISPASYVKVGSSTTVFSIEKSFASRFGSNEGAKWSRYPNCAVKVKSPDGVTRFGQSTIQSVSGNTITLASALSFTPQAGDLLELADYDFASTTDQIKLLYGFMRDTAFGDGKSQYQMV